MVLGKVKSFTISYDCLNDSNVPVFSSGDCVSGRVIIEVTGEIRVKSLKIHAKGFAKVRWTESRNAGSNTAYTQNYTEELEYLNHKEILIGHERGKTLTIFDLFFEKQKNDGVFVTWNQKHQEMQSQGMMTKPLTWVKVEQLSHYCLTIEREYFFSLVLFFDSVYT